MPAHRPCVLIVEPRKELREALKEILTDTFLVLAGQTSSGALVGFEHHSPRVVLISMVQNEGNGFELCRRLSALQSVEHSLFVVYGAPPPELPEYVQEEIQVQYGVDRYIPSGATLKGLAEIAREHLRQGWKFKAAQEPAKADSSGEERWSNPFTTTDVVSAKNEEEPGGFSLRKLFRRRD